MTDYDTFTLGRLTSPITASTNNTLLQDGDPALYWFTQWIEGVIRVHTKARWDAELAQLGISFNVNVLNCIPYDPVPHFQEAQFQLPLLAVWRTDSDFKDTSTTWPKRISTWDMNYILPPLTPSQLERLVPILNVVESAVFDRINQDYDPAVLGGQPLKDLMQTEYITVLKSSPSRDFLRTGGSTSGNANAMLFPVLRMRFEVAERKMQTTFENWSGLDVAVSQGS